MKQTLIVSPETGGHCPFYLSLLAEAFTSTGCKILADSSCHDIHDHFKRRDIIENEFVFIQPKEKSPKGILKQVRELVLQHKFDSVFYAYLDTHIETLLSSTQPIGCSVTGIWFHPYALASHYKWLPPLDKRLRLRRNIHRKLKHSIAAREIKHLFFLDDGSPSALKSINPQITSSVLIDPGETPPKLSSTEARSHFKLPNDRTIFLHAGSSERRKGFADVLKAFQQLSKDPAISQKALLIRVGSNSKLHSKDRQRLDQLIAEGIAWTTDDYVSHSDFIEYFSASDWVIIPYRNFRFSSGILANAMTSDTPIIASNYGLIGRYASQLKNGDVYHHKSWRSLENAIRRHIDDRRDCEHHDSMNHSKGSFIEQIRASEKSNHTKMPQ